MKKNFNLSKDEKDILLSAKNVYKMKYICRDNMGKIFLHNGVLSRRKCRNMKINYDFMFNFIKRSETYNINELLNVSEKDEKKD